MRDGVRGAADVGALASLAPGRLAVMVWHYHDDDVAGPDARIELVLGGLPIVAGNARVTHYRIDETHSNAYGAWKRMGSPVAPTASQYAQLVAAGRLEALDAGTTGQVENGSLSLRFGLPRQGVSLLVVEWP